MSDVFSFCINWSNVLEQGICVSYNRGQYSKKMMQNVIICSAHCYLIKSTKNCQILRHCRDFLAFYFYSLEFYVLCLFRQIWTCVILERNSWSLSTNLRGDTVSSQEWYMEYQIHRNRPGLLGDIASILGMLTINIITINGVENRRRGMLLETNNLDKIESLKQILARVEDITLTALRPPKLVDRIAIRHGRYLERSSEDNQTYFFTREELGILVDFMAELFRRPGHQIVGLRGMPRVGKTESIVASSVCANKRWIFLSSTLLKQTVRTNLSKDEFSEERIFIIDGAVSTMRGNEEHQMLLQEIMRFSATKVIEHPDVFVRSTGYTLSDFDHIIELKNDANETIVLDEFEQNL